MSHFQRWNSIPAKLKCILWEKMQCKASWHQVHKSAACTLGLLRAFRLGWLCCLVNNPYRFLLLQQLQNKLLSDTGNLFICPLNMKNHQRSHISATLDKVNYVKKNKWKNTLQNNFHRAKKLPATSGYKYVWSFSLIEVS